MGTLVLAVSVTCYNPFDPIQDTESPFGLSASPFVILVTTHSIRFRILKVCFRLSRRGGRCVTTHSIRFRILKGFAPPPVEAHSMRYNPFDPIQDTESCSPRALLGARPRYNPFDPIQDTESGMRCDGIMASGSYNPFDPIQDTESRRGHAHPKHEGRLQPIRSDSGY